jgi:hypothetical protein
VLLFPLCAPVSDVPKRGSCLHHVGASPVAESAPFACDMPSLDGATGWVNSDPLGPAELRGHVVLVNFWTLTCINWLRQGLERLIMRRWWPDQRPAGG